MEKYLDPQTLGTIAGVIVVAQIIYGLLSKTVLEAWLGPQEPKEGRDPKWPLMTNFICTGLSLALGLAGSAFVSGGPLTSGAVFGGLLVGLFAAGVQVLGYEWIKNLLGAMPS